MTSIKLNIANENGLLFERIMEFIKSLPRNEEEIRVEIKKESLSKEDEFKSDMKQVFKELELAKQGKIKLTAIEDLINDND